MAPAAVGAPAAEPSAASRVEAPEDEGAAYEAAGSPWFARRSAIGLIAGAVENLADGASARAAGVVPTSEAEAVAEPRAFPWFG